MEKGNANFKLTWSCILKFYSGHFSRVTPGIPLILLEIMITSCLFDNSWTWVALQLANELSLG